MLPSPVLIDASAIVSIFYKKDGNHQLCAKTLLSLNPPQLTTWPVLTEVQWLLRKRPGAMESVFSALKGGLFDVKHIGSEAFPWLGAYLEKYQNIDAQLADVSLMYLADTMSLNTLFTLDRRNFQVYRTTDNRSLDIIPGID